MSDFETRMEEAKRASVELGFEKAEPDLDPDGALLVKSFGVGMEAESEERSIEIIEEEILFYKAQAGLSFLEIGHRLIEAKKQLSHGEWERWLTEKVDFSVRSAQRFMRLAEGYGKSDTVALLGSRKALALLALEPFEREEFMEEMHDISGEKKTVQDMTAAELEKAIRERDEARKAAEEARTKASAAEEDRDKMAADMKILKALQQSAKEAEEKKAAELCRVEKELEELKAKPVEVAVQEKDASPEQIAKAKADGEAAAARKHKADIEAKELELKRAREELKKAREEAKDANVKAGQLEKQLIEARKSASNAEKAAGISGNEKMLKFKVLFEQAQVTVNQMADLAGRETEENRKKMQNAMRALSEAIGKAAGA